MISTDLDQLRDLDFHPDEDDVRVFTIPRSGVLRAEPGTLVYEIRYGQVVVRHYAFADQWFKVNITTDQDGRLIETRSPEEGIPPFAINCDIATPLTWSSGHAVAVDLFLDVLVRADTTTYQVRDQDEFDQAVRERLITRAEADGARRGLATFVRLIDDQQLLTFLADITPFGPTTAPAALPDSRVPLAEAERLIEHARVASQYRAAETPAEFLRRTSDQEAADVVARYGEAALAARLTDLTPEQRRRLEELRG